MTESALAGAQVESRQRGSRMTPGAAQLAGVIAKNVKLVRTRRGYSFEKLGELANVSRSMLHQIERGKSVPTIVVLWKIAQALEVTLDTLMSSKEMALAAPGLPGSQAREVRFVCRSLADACDNVEVLELRLIGNQLFLAEPRGRDSLAHVAVSSGKIAVTLGDGRTARLQRGDALTFKADVPYSLRNLSSDFATLHVVVHVRSVGDGAIS